MNEKKLIRSTIIVHGDVQKSDYRGRVISIAKKVEITGTIRNLDNENVKIIAEGDSRDIDYFCDIINIKNFLINVEDVERIRDIEINEDDREYEDFYKIVVEPQLKLSEGETDARLDRAAELLKDLAEEMGNGFKSQKGYNARLDSFITRIDEHNRRIDEHNLRLEKILEKLAEK